MKPRILNMQNEMKELKNINVIDDCNNINLDTGIYYCIGSTQNVPYDSAWFLNVMKTKGENGDTIITQIAYRYRQNMIYIRNYNSVNGSPSWKEWVEILSDTGWQDLSLNNGWQNMEGNFPKAQYRLINGQVFLRGLITNTSSSPEVLLTLPNTIRPKKIAHSTIIESDSIKYVYIDSNGQIHNQNYGKNNWISLGNISYFID